MMPNKYYQALARLRNKPAHKLERVGNQRRIPDLLSQGINAPLGLLVLNLFADNDNAKCPTWYIAEDNMLMQEWSERLAELGDTSYGNPPYSHPQYHEKQVITGTTCIMKYVAVQYERGSRHIFLTKATPNEMQWLENADHIVSIRRHIGFDPPVWFVPADEKRRPTSTFFAGATVVFDRSQRGEWFSYINCTELEAKRRVFMTLAQFIANKSQPATATPPVAGEPEVESSFTQKDIFDISGVETWACARAAFGDKEECTFSEPKFRHTQAADLVDAPEFAQVSPLMIDKAKLLIREDILFGMDERLLSTQFDDSVIRLDMSERVRTIAIEASGKRGASSTDFTAVVGNPDVSRWFNIRQIRMYVREKAQPVADPHPESRI